MVHRNLGALVVMALTMPAYATEMVATAPEQTTTAVQATAEQQEIVIEPAVQPRTPYAIGRLDDATIAQELAKITNDTDENYKMRVGLKTVAGLAAAYVAYKVLLERHLKGEEPAPAAGSWYASNERVKVLEDRFARFEYALDPGWFTWQWFKNWGSYVGKGFVGMIATKKMFDMTEQLMDTVFHDGSLSWFIKSKTHIIESIKEFSDYANNAPGNATLKVSPDGTVAQVPAPIVEFAPEHNKAQLAFIAHNIVKHMGATIAFMQLRVDKMAQGPANTVGVAEGNNLILRLKVMTNDFAESVETALNNEHAKVMPYMSRFAAELGRATASFSRIEHENPVQ